MNKEKMLQLANIVENAHPKTFSLGAFFGEWVNATDWIEEDGEGYTSYDEREEIIEQVYDGDPNSQIVVAKSFIPNMKRMIDEDTNTIKVDCNTTACLAGWVVVNEWITGDELSKESIESMGIPSVVYEAQRILEISDKEVQNLFYCNLGGFWHKHAGEYGFNFHPDYCETWNLDNKKVADVLRKIVSGEVSLVEDSEEE